MNDVEQLNELAEWSVKLGFYGAMTDEFFKKLERVKKVRKRIKGEIIMSIGAFIMSTSIYTALYYNIYTNEYRDTAMIFMLFAILLSCFSVLAHVRVVAQWQNHDKEMIDEWTKMNTTETRINDLTKQE
jgi:uncharacterized membrane protein